MLDIRNRNSFGGEGAVIVEVPSRPTGLDQAALQPRTDEVSQNGGAQALNHHSGSFDVIRVGACLAVVLLHLSATIVMQPDQLGTFSWHIANFIDSATRWCVPVFVMLSGALLLAPEKSVSPREFWIRRMNRILPALIFWSAVYLAWRAYFWKEPLSIETIFHDLIVGRPYIHLYFLFLIAGLYLITPFLATAVASLGRKQLAQVIVIIAAVALGANLFDFLASTSFTLSVPYITYYLAGLYCVRFMVYRPALHGMLLAGAIALTTGFTAMLTSTKGFDSRWSFYFYEDFSPTGIMVSVAVFMVLLHVSIPTKVLPVARRLAPWTFGVYVAHPLIVEILRHVYHTTLPMMFRPLYYVPFTFVATIALSFGFVALVHRVPVLRRVM